MQPRLLFFSCANYPFQDFVPLYAVSALYHNPDSVCEIGLQEGFEQDPLLMGAFRSLDEIFGESRFLHSAVSWITPNGRSIVPNTVRFVTEPRGKAEFLYIGDVDIILLEDILPSHLADMEKTGLPYSNIVRPGGHRMSGLHFSRYSAYYPLPSLEGVDISVLGDEAVLYQLVSKKGHELRPAHAFRPAHGIHVSPNRNPKRTGSKPGWNISAYAERYRTFVNTLEFRLMSRYFSERVRSILYLVDRTIWESEKSRQREVG